MNLKKVVIDGKTLSLSDIILIARGYHERHHHLYPVVEINEHSKTILAEFRAGLQERIDAGDIIYGTNTGCGIKKGTIIPNDEIEAYQAHYIPAHCVCTGAYFAKEIVRVAMIARANSFCKGNSGVRLEAVAKIVELYNADIIPAIPSLGSVGSSGDLAPLAHMSAAMMGLPGQKVFYKGEEMEAKDALEQEGIERLVLAAKEAMSLTNGSTFILATGLLALYDANKLIQYSHIATALSLEAIRGEKKAFDSRLHEARNHQSAVDVAKIILDFTDKSTRMTEESRNICLPAEKSFKTYSDKLNDVAVPRVQDAYSFRGYPQVAGGVVDAFLNFQERFLHELNASTDNPLLFRDGEKFESISGGNFHGEPLALQADFFKIALQSLANISNSRFYALTKPKTSYGLPGDLAGPNKSDLNTGLMILQYSGAALVSANKVLCTPSVIDSIPTSADQEDYVSMGAGSAKNLREVVANTYAVIAAEILGAVQGIALTENDLSPHHELGKVTGRVYNLVLDKVPELPIMEDGIMLNLIWEKVKDLMLTGEMMEVIKKTDH